MVGDVTPEYCTCRTLVLGCGNELFGDDGFGPAVARRLEQRPELRGDPNAEYRVGDPPSLLAMDVGSGVREVLFDLVLSPVRPLRIVIVDAVQMGRQPGEVWAIPASDLPRVKLDDFSMHQLPTSNLLRELSELGGVSVVCLVAQAGELPSEVRPGLSPPMRRVVERAAEMILQDYGPGGHKAVVAGAPADPPAEPRGARHG